MTAAILDSRLAQGVAVVALGAVLGVAAALDAVDVRALSIVLVLCILTVVSQRRRRDQAWAGAEWPHILLLAVVARLLAGCAHLVVGLILFGGNVDLTGYQNFVGIATQQVLRGDIVPIEQGLFFVEQSGIAYLMVPFYLVMGPSLVGMVFIASLIGFLGSFLFLRAFQIAGPPEGDVRFFGAMMFFLPTLVFWGTLFGKDSTIFLCVAAVAWAFARTVKGQASLGSNLCLITSLVVATAIRAHMGLALAIGLGVAWFARPSTLQGGAQEVLRPLRGAGRAALVCLVAAGPVYLMGSLWGHGPTAIIDELVLRHRVMSSVTSDLGIQGFASSLPPRITGDSPWEFVAFLPEGFLTALYRPLPFDVHNAQAAVAAVEGTALLLVTIRRRLQLFLALRQARSNPFMMFCVTYFLVGTWILSFHRNLGVVTRQRSMILPFLLIMLAASVTRRAAVATPTDHPAMASAETRS